jgi:cytochrome P450
VWPEYNANPYEYIRACAARYGDVFRLPLPVWDVVVLNHPDFVTEVLCDPEDRFSMVGPLGGFTDRLGSALPSLEGPRFRQRRKSLTPMFSRRNLAAYSGDIADEFVKRIDAWDRFAQSGQTVDLLHEIALVTLPAFMRSMYSTSMPADQLVRIDKDIRMMMAAAGTIGGGPATLPPNLLPLPGLDSVPAAYQRLRRLAGRMIDERLANPIERADLLDVVTKATEADGSPIARKDMLNELIILMGGGFDTVVNAVAWTLGLLTLNPQPRQRLYDEVDTVLGGARPTLADLGKLTWTKACFDEGQRLQGGPLNTRFAMADLELAGYQFPKGTLFGVGWYSIHRDPRWWPDPERFDPTRFTDKDVAAARPTNAFVPFGAGPHHCIGSGMAYMNAQFLLAIIAQRYRLTTPTGWRPRHDYALATGIKGGLPVTLSRRPTDEHRKVAS